MSQKTDFRVARAKKVTNISDLPDVINSQKLNIEKNVKKELAFEKEKTGELSPPAVIILFIYSIL